MCNLSYAALLMYTSHNIYDYRILTIYYSFTLYTYSHIRSIFTIHILYALYIYTVDIWARGGAQDPTSGNLPPCNSLPKLA